VARGRSSRPEGKPLRLFLAFEIGDDPKAAIETAIAPWRAELPSARWAPRENWHVTLEFLGNTWPRLVPRVEQAAAEVAAGARAFEAGVRGFGGFPSPTKARVLWAGIDDPSGSTAELAARLGGALAGDFVPEKRAFHAHLTIARADPPLAVPDDLRRIGPLGPRFLVDRIVLFQSHLRRPAPVYEAFRTYALTGR
jgi:RNA 2',3'-cyclic 3'-phosphodiesterase